MRIHVRSLVELAGELGRAAFEARHVALTTGLVVRASLLGVRRAAD